jgi:hypothetical protein
MEAGDSVVVNPATALTPEERAAALRSDDPVAAVAALLATRGVCLARHDASCLDSVDQWGSPAFVADRELARPSGTQSSSGDPLASVGEIELVQRFGAAALLRGAITVGGDAAGTTKKPVSLLVMRSETGWRIRAYDSG